MTSLAQNLRSSGRGCTIVVGVLLSAAAQAQTADWWDPDQSSAVCSAAHDQEAPAISSGSKGPVVVWQDKRPAGKKPGTKFSWSIYGKYLKAYRQFIVFQPADSNGTSPDIDGDHVVFLHNRGWSNVMGVDLADKPLAPKEIEGPSFTPAVSGNLVVFESSKHRWQNPRPPPPPRPPPEIGGIDIVWDITNSEQVLQRNPRICGPIVVWQESRRNDWNNFGIYYRNISTDPDPIHLTKTPNASASHPDVWDQIIVWQDNRNVSWDIHGYDVAAKKKWVICGADGDQTHPAIHGSIVVWQDSRSGNWDIYGADLKTGDVRPIYIGKADQTAADIHGNVVVWQDNRDSNSDIYMNRR